MDSKIREIAEQLGVDPGRIARSETLSERHGHRIWRLHTPERPYILKWFPDDASATVEVAAYRLLAELQVPTLPVHGMTGQALLLEDLQSSPCWRLASEKDMEQPQVGEAVAGWYREFHARGRRFLSGDRPRPSFLSRESDRLDEVGILAIGDDLSLSELPIWQLAAEHIGLLKDAESRLDLTLNYNDFYWTNLALSREGALCAVIFDYHLWGMGMHYSDCRNVAGSLGERAAAAFREAYGEVDPRESVIDRPLSTLIALFTATRRPDFPAWAEGSLRRAKNGNLERDLREAIAVARTICEANA
jgi:hypothetical protein